MERKFAYEFVDEGWGFYRFHHHHMHISFSGTSVDNASARSGVNDDVPCITRGSDPEALDAFYKDTCQ